MDTSDNPSENNKDKNHLLENAQKNLTLKRESLIQQKKSMILNKKKAISMRQIFPGDEKINININQNLNININNKLRTNIRSVIVDPKDSRFNSNSNKEKK